MPGERCYPLALQNLYRLPEELPSQWAYPWAQAGPGPAQVGTTVISQTLARSRACILLTPGTLPAHSQCLLADLKTNVGALPSESGSSQHFSRIPPSSKAVKDVSPYDFLSSESYAIAGDN